MLQSVARFELRYQMGNPVFWFASFIMFALAFGSMAVPDITIGSGGAVHKNAPLVVLQTQLIFSLFALFVTTAFVANSIVRDDDSGFAPIIRSTSVGKRNYLLGRFLGAFMAAALAFLVVPIALLLGSLMPWLDPDTLGSIRLAPLLFGYGFLALPNLFFGAAALFAFSTLTRSMLYAQLGAVVLLILYVIFNSATATNPELRDAAGLFDPFGIVTLRNAVRYWTSDEANSQIPTVVGALLFNRLALVAAGTALLTMTLHRFQFKETRVPGKWYRLRWHRQVLEEAPPVLGTLPMPDQAKAAWPRFVARFRFEMRFIFLSPAFLMLLIAGLANSLADLVYANDHYGTPALPYTFVFIDTLAAYSIVPIVIAIFYSGELVWRDRDRRINEIIDATALPSWAFLLPKVLAVAAVLFMTFAAAVAAAIAIQIAKGHYAIEPGKYLLWYLLPRSVDAVILAVLAVFVQSLSPSKYVGWGIMLLYLVATISFELIGLEHPLYRYGSNGHQQFSDMNGDAIGGPLSWSLRLHWGACAIIFSVLAHLLWPRGAERTLRVRLARLPHQIRGTPAALLFATGLIWAGSGTFIYHNTNILNDFATEDAHEARLAAFERKYLRFEKVAQPSLTDIRLAVDLFPSDRKAITRGSYRFINDTGAPLERLYLRLPDSFTRLEAVSVVGAELESNDARFQFRIYRFTQPLAPEARGTIHFVTERHQRGFRANGDDIQLVENGSFLNNYDLAPRIGMDRSGLLADPATRRKFGLPSELRPAKLEDRTAQRRNYFHDADWVRSDITISTDASQTPIAPGNKQSDVIKGGRRTARFVSDVPILAFFSVQSARYIERAMMSDGVRLSVHYHPSHGANVQRMLDVMKASLAYYSRSFGPYHLDHARIVEFPGYEEYAQAYAGTIPYSEKRGFIADARAPYAIDYVGYVTAHELAHQYWAHQIIGADMQGARMVTETLAQYSALMVMKQVHGEDNIRRFLKYELDHYLQSRKSERNKELPLARSENQLYIHGRKGALVLYLLQERFGEVRVNAMLSEILQRYRFKGPPYPRSADLVEGYLSLARTSADRELVHDLLERITLYDLQAKRATTSQLPDGSYETKILVAAEKYYDDGTGRQTRAQLADTITVGLFHARPGFGAFQAKDVIAKVSRPITSGVHTIRILSRQKPSFAGIDPYNLYIDRNSEDNVVPVS